MSDSTNTRTVFSKLEFIRNLPNEQLKHPAQAQWQKAVALIGTNQSDQLESIICQHPILCEFCTQDGDKYELRFPLYFVCQRGDFMLPVFPAVAH